MPKTPDILAKIAHYKRGEVAALKSQISLNELRKKADDMPPAKSFTQAIKSKAINGPALIAEVKKASPSKGIIREDFNPAEIAKAYTDGGAACLSVLTDAPSFQGSNEIFADVRAVTSLPMLRKDFMLEPIQIAESRAMGADAVLIIMAMLDEKTARALMNEAKRHNMDALVETHDAEEVDRAITLGAELIGINNRDLRSFHTTLDTFAPLAERVPAHATLIAESGIFTPNDILKLTQGGASGFLVGESLMRQDDVKRATYVLRGIQPA
ncbi:MAG: indole-3-glycerol phosphate synthase TrpC [Maricaulaceae bacterium]